MKAVIEKLDHLEKEFEKSIGTVEKMLSVLLGAISILTLLMAIFKFVK